VYIDGFNLYYGCLRHSPWKWLDPVAMCRKLLPRHHLSQIRYFTSMISARLDDPSAPQRQSTYLRALRTLPMVSVHLGQFTTHVRRLPLASSPPGSPQYVDVHRTDEKGTDVNIATHLLVDGYENKYECAVLITNDSDLLEPVRVVRQKLGKIVGIINPHVRASKQLRSEATFMKQIRTGVLESSQFPPVMSDVHGIITKPSAW